MTIVSLLLSNSKRIVVQGFLSKSFSRGNIKTAVGLLSKSNNNFNRLVAFGKSYQRTPGERHSNSNN